MRARDLSGFVLQDVRKSSLQNAGAAAVEAGGMVAKLSAAAAGLDADETHFPILNEGMEDANRVRAAAHARDHRIRQPSLGAKNLHAGFAADHGLKIAHH